MEDKAKILVVDDNPQNLRVVGSTLVEHGYKPFMTLNGEKALEFLDREKPELILLDVMMPEMDGFELCRRIKETELAAVPVIFLTAKSEIEEVLRGFELGAVDYLTKPFNPLELIARIRLHIELKRAREEIRTLKGILPLCSFCKKVRDDAGYWSRVDTYIERNTDLDVSHGVCPDCMKQHYPDIDCDAEIVCESDNSGIPR